MYIYSCYSITIARRKYRYCYYCSLFSENTTFFSLRVTPSHVHGIDAFVLLSQMKELGVIFYNCSCLVLDLQRIFALYSSLKFKSRVPQTWSKRLYGIYDNEKKLQLQLNETKSQAFVSVSFALFSSSLLPPKALY